MNIMYYSMYILHISITHSTTHSTYIYIVYIHIYSICTYSNSMFIYMRYIQNLYHRYLKI